jgi:hypothetical protein
MKSNNGEMTYSYAKVTKVNARQDYSNISPGLASEQEHITLLSESCSNHRVEHAIQIEIKEHFLRYQRTAEFKSAFMQACRFKPAFGCPTFGKILFQDEGLCLMLTGLHKSSPIPAHDHPGITAAQLIVYGSIRVRHYRDPSNGQERITHLLPTSDITLGEGDIDGISLADNTHDVAAMTENAVMLNLQRTTKKGMEMHWYFPATSEHGDIQFWRCVSGKKYLRESS